MTQLVETTKIKGDGVLGPRAPLTILDGAPKPYDVKAWWFKGADGIRLRGAFVPPRDENRARGTVLMLSGRADFIEKHFESLTDLQAKGFQCLTMDCRGQGLSERLLPHRLKGHMDSYDMAVQDLDIFLKLAKGLIKPPFLVLAHSMGAAIATQAMINGVLKADRVVLSSPMFGINTGVVSERIARMVTKGLMGFGMSAAFFPGRATDPLHEALAQNTLTHDKVRFKRSQDYMRVNADLMLGGVTVGWLYQSFSLLDRLWADGAMAKVHTPVLVLAADPDLVVVADKAREAAGQMPNAAYVPLTGARHEVLHETDDVRAKFWDEFMRFCV